VKGYGSTGAKALVEPGAGATVRFIPFVMFIPDLIYRDDILFIIRTAFVTL